MGEYTMSQLFTDEELRACVEIYRPTNGGSAAIDRMVSEVILPVLPRINALTGQENDARYLAYAVEAVIMILNPDVPHSPD